jgi:hypothetical protein
MVNIAWWWSKLCDGGQKTVGGGQKMSSGGEYCIVVIEKGAVIMKIAWLWSKTVENERWMPVVVKNVWWWSKGLVVIEKKHGGCEKSMVVLKFL